MGSFSIWHWVIVLGIALLLFGGGGKLSRLMGDFGRGLREFKSSLEEGVGKRVAKSKDAEEGETTRTKTKKADRTADRS